MRTQLTFALLFFSFVLTGQTQNDLVIQKLREKYSGQKDIKCQILVKVEVEGIHIPEKKIYVEFQKGKKPVIKGEGLLLLPKKGTADQFAELLSSNFQAIFLQKKGAAVCYKLVSLDPASDWITADIWFTEKNYNIIETIVNSKKHGTFSALYTYSDKEMPIKSVITFDVKKFKLPLKFIGREQGLTEYPENDKVSRGKITLNYIYL